MASTPTSLNGASEMTRGTALSGAHRLWAAFILGTVLLAGAAVYAAMPEGAPTAVPGTAASSAATPSGSSKAAASKPQAVQPAQAAVKPLWVDLSPAQQQALAPLAAEWDSLDSFRKDKWLAIGNKYAKMKPHEQQRVQERMRDWVTLTPEQRRIARESYARAKKLNPDQKSAHWQQYQQLPEEQKKKLAADAASKKHVATLPSATAQGNHSKTVPPIKSTPKPVIERSVTPQAANQPALQPSSPAPGK